MRDRPALSQPLCRLFKQLQQGWILLLSGLVLSFTLSYAAFTPAALATPAADAPAIAQGSSPAVPTQRPKIDELAQQASQSYIGNEFGPFNLFIIFFITLGPLKVIPPFVQLTRNASRQLRAQLAFRSAVISTIVILLVVIIGQRMLPVWQVQLPALMIAGGILLSLVSLRLLLAQYDAKQQTVLSPEEPDLSLAITPLTFPTILPPFGIAIALTLMVIATKIGYRPVIIIGLLLLVMGLNLVCMLAARPIFKFIRPVTLRILGFTLSVMQFALGIQFILLGLEIQALILRLLWQSNPS